MAVHGTFPTDRAERYAKQLAGHWSSKATVTTVEDGIRLEMQRGGVTVLRPEADRLRVEANTPEFGEVVKAHLERFAQRDGLVLTWDS